MIAASQAAGFSRQVQASFREERINFKMQSETYLLSTFKTTDVASERSHMNGILP